MTVEQVMCPLCPETLPAEGQPRIVLAKHLKAHHPPSQPADAR